MVDVEFSIAQMQRIIRRNDVGGGGSGARSEKRVSPRSSRPVGNNSYNLG